jgi:hypothetical protein
MTDKTQKPDEPVWRRLAREALARQTDEQAAIYQMTITSYAEAAPEPRRPTKKEKPDHA